MKYYRIIIISILVMMIQRNACFAKSVYYYSYDSKKTITKKVDLNGDGKKEQLRFSRQKDRYDGSYSDASPIIISVNGKRLKKNVVIKQAVIVDLNKKDRNVELVFKTANKMYIYRFRSGKMVLYAVGDNKRRRCPLDDCPFVATKEYCYESWEAGYANLSKKFFPGNGTIKVPIMILSRYKVENDDGDPRMCIFKGTIIYRVEKGRIRGDCSRIYSNRIDYNTETFCEIKMADGICRVEKIKFSGKYLYLSLYNRTTGRRFTQMSPARAAKYTYGFMYSVRQFGL